jgi:hypothetical protein
MIHLPARLPSADEATLWQLQNHLLDEAQTLLGARDAQIQVCQPVFRDGGPRLRNTPNRRGAFAELSLGAANSWPTTIYELGHETVHILNPVAGHTNWLEEGVAVDFSIWAQNRYQVQVQQPSSGPYFEALQLVRGLPGGTFAAARQIRNTCGALSAADIGVLRKLFPSSVSSNWQKLCAQCVPR